MVLDEPVDGNEPVNVLGPHLVVDNASGRATARILLGGNDGGARAVLTVQLSDQVAPDDGVEAFLRVTAAVLTSALSRINLRRMERRAADVERAMSETIQRSLLTAPLQPDHLQVAVRYQAAVEQAQIGGDWYDSFLSPTGDLTLVVGDVAGHDYHAAARMAQVRNLLRGVAYTSKGSPAVVLAGLDEAMDGLGVNAYATVVLARIEQDAEQHDQGVRTLRWTNAGHPPPILVSPDGIVTMLAERPELLVGVSTSAERSDHTVVLEDGSSIVFYTDGLIERRTSTIDAGFEALTAALAGLAHHTAEEICDALLDRFGHDAEDDIVLLVVRAYSQVDGRPAEAGPVVLPGDLPLDFLNTGRMSR